MLDMELVPGGGIVDVELGNNFINTVYVVDDREDFIPLREDFQASDINQLQWTVINYDDDVGWELRDAAGLQADNRSAFINLYDYTGLYEEDWLISPALDLSMATEASLFFRTSYARNIGRVDKLRVLASRDCGNTFDQLLLDLSGTLLSDLVSADYWQPGSSNDWSEFSVDLSEYAGEQHVRIAFVTVNGNGNNLFLDNIEFYTTAEEDVIRTARNDFVLYPNPSRNGTFNLTVYTQEREDVDILIYTLQGQEIYRSSFPNTLNQTYDFSLDGHPQGVYVIKMTGADFVRTRKLVLSRY
jgi:hypothetical protein